MLSFQFGIGAAFITPLTVGNPPSPSGPRRILTIAEASIDFDGKIEKLMGQNKNPDDVAASDQDFKFKMNTGRLGLDIYNLMFGETVAAGYSAIATDEGPTPIPNTNSIVTTFGASFTEDLGVLNAATLQPLQQVASAPVTGQYAVNVTTGTYTFAAADNSNGGKVSVLISYRYTPATTTQRTLTIQNRIQGYGPVVEIILVANYTSAGAPQPLGAVRIRAARITKMGLPFKRNGYLMTPIEGEAFPDASGSLIDIWSVA